MDIKARLHFVQQEISDACEKAHRSPSDITLIAVTKGHDFSLLRAAYALGVRDFGESYAKELEHKMACAHEEGMDDIRWHFIGGIQSNKLKIIKKASFIHSISSLKHAKILNKIADEPIKIFIQVNLDGAPARQGFLPDEAMAAVAEIVKFDRLRLMGLMAVLPLHQSADEDAWFLEMVRLKEAILKKGWLKEVSLSMGMSDDFQRAIFFGTDFVRIGTGIFGERR